MIYCRIADGLVVNRTVFDGPIPQGWAAPGAIWIEHEEAQIGWSYAEGVFAPPPAPPPGPPSPSDVVAEQRRRLALGYDFDFGDARGVHHIATTEKDMQDWQEVTSWANARTARGDKVSTITIATASGLAEITAPEWWSIVDAGTAARQPIFQGAFWLLAQDPVPPDYATNDAYWGG